MIEWLTADFETLVRILVSAILSYFLLILILRLSGKRSLSKMNAFDFVITVALGSAFATILTSDSLSITEGLAVLAVLLGLQYLVTWTASRIRPFVKVLKSSPSLLYYEGEYLHDNMKRERVLEDEIQQAARSSGFCSMTDVLAVVLETDGTLSVMGNGSQAGVHDLLPHP